MTRFAGKHVLVEVWLYQECFQEETLLRQSYAAVNKR